MLYVFHGSDTHKIADRTNATVASLRAKRPEVQVYRFEGELVDLAPVDELVAARGLFVEKHVVVMHGVCEKAESRERVFERLQQFAASENIFILSEGVLHAAHKKVFETHAHKVEEHAKKEGRAYVFDAYGIACALKGRNKRALWDGYLRAQRAGEKAEAICGLLHWAVRDMLQSPGQYAQKYSQEELTGLSRALIAMYHKAHAGEYDLDVALEHWILSL